MMLVRLFTRQLIAWKDQEYRKPLLLDGARQVGKSWLIERAFGAQHFQQVLKLDFLANPGLAALFTDRLNPDDIIQNIELEVDFSPATDLLFFDEIEWLEKNKLISRCYPIDCEPKSPLSAYRNENFFKLFLFDIGLLDHMLDISYKEHLQQSFEYKGYLPENFVQNEFHTMGYYPTYSREFRQAEIEFLYKTDSGEVVPVEVKSGSRTRAKSLRVCCDRYSPAKTLKLIGSVGGGDKEDQNLTWPLYYAVRVMGL